MVGLGQDLRGHTAHKFLGHVDASSPRSALGVARIQSSLDNHVEGQLFYSSLTTKSFWKIGSFDFFSFSFFKILMLLEPVENLKAGVRTGMIFPSLVHSWVSRNRCHPPAPKMLARGPEHQPSAWTCTLTGWPVSPKKLG